MGYTYSLQNCASAIVIGRVLRAFCYDNPQRYVNIANLNIGKVYKLQ